MDGRMETDDGVTANGVGDSEDNSSVRVALRIRPSLPREVIEGCKTCTSVAEGHPQVWIGSNHAFTYDYVFDLNTPQYLIFDNVVKQLLDGCLNGYNATILAYGQTGSGKTYTMGTGFGYDSSEEIQGIIPRAVTYLFSQIETMREERAAEKIDFKVQVNFVELYNEEVVDLLSQTLRPSSATTSRPSSATGPIRIHEDTNGSIYLVGVQTVQVSSCHETLSYLRDGALSRTTASTNMNDTSSRSHAIFTMHVTQTKVSNEFGEAELETLTAKFHFVDLAGSERLKRTLATGDRAKEGISINCGLLALGNVISALGDKSRKVSHVPYRDSKLTRLLQDSLGGNSRTVMIACVSPSDRDFVETLNTLKYANRARNIKNRVQINQDKSSRTIASLRKQIDQLEMELLEFKQGKMMAADTLEYKDMYQENMLLLAEVESLKSRLKSKQESIDKLNQMVAVSRAEEELKTLSITGADCDLTSMIQKYLTEIEDLRTKLYEAEQECQKLRSKQRQMNTSLSSPRRQLFESVNSSPVSVIASDILHDAKADVASDKRKLEQLSSREKDDEGSGGDDSGSDSEEQEKMEEIVQLSSEINVKERLIEELERSHKHMENMKRHYEEKLDCLFSKVKATEQERDKVLSSLTNGKRSAQVNADYEKKLVNMQAEIKKWQNLQKEHAVALKNQANKSRELDRLKAEVENLKQNKVKLLKQSKIESAKFREIEQRRQKEIMSLKKAQRAKDIKLKTLENEKHMKDQVLKRKLEEVNNLKRINKLQMSRKAAGKRPTGSPLKAKSKWNSLQHEIRQSVAIKSTAAGLEKEMMNLIQERCDARKRLCQLEDEEDFDELVQEEIESTKTNLNFLEDRITDIQNQIAEMSSGVKEIDSSSLDHEEMEYVFKKVFDMNIGNLTELDRSERRVDDLEETVKQQNREIASLRELLHHTISRYRSLNGDDEDDVPELPPPSLLDYSNTNWVASASASVTTRVRKARRLTSTTQELLGSLENVSKPDTFLNPNKLDMGAFNRGNRLTQSLRGPSTTTNRRRPPLLRQDTYNVTDRRPMTVKTSERALPPEMTNGNDRNDIFNTTFLVEKSPPTTATSASIIPNSSSADSNNYDNNTNMIDGKGIIRRVTSAVKERVLNYTHSAEGHSKPVISLCATDDRLFTGSKDSTAKEFDLTTGVEVACYEGHPNNVQCVKFIEHESTLITASSCIVKLWDVRTNTCQRTLRSSGVNEKIVIDSRLLPSGEHHIHSVAVLRNYLYTSFEGRIRVWDRRNLKGSLGLLAGKHSSNIMCLEAAADVQIGNESSDIIASGSKDHYIKLYQIDPTQPIESITPRKNLNPPHYDGIEALLIKGSELYSGSRDTCIKRWDMVEAKMICCSTNAHSNWITGLSNLPNRSLDFVISSSRDGFMKIWDKDLKEVLRVDVGQCLQQSNFSVESLCVNSRFVFTAGGNSSNSNTTAVNGIVREFGFACWEYKEDALLNSRNGNDLSP